jgi:hypothetical protein
VIFTAWVLLSARIKGQWSDREVETLNGAITDSSRMLLFECSGLFVLSTLSRCLHICTTPVLTKLLYYANAHIFYITITMQDKSMPRIIDLRVHCGGRHTAKVRVEVFLCSQERYLLHLSSSQQILINRHLLI